ncbi:MAG: efflux RND transporter periplasmic adaptor subunit [Prevotellaceae bacterium]|jgi:RND family efflux transporter MFP subunit|nr:efflux RND transporter periplasmic adaptor subunit [Prevotellaceae bacterium]
MKFHNRFTVGVIAFVLLIVACSDRQQGVQNDIATPVTVKELKKGSISKLINTTGTALSTYNVDLISQMSGIYHLQTNPRTGKPFKLGDRVSQGQLIIRLEDREYENGIALDAKELNLEIAEQEQVKQKALYEKGGATLSEMRNTEVRVTNARHDVEGARLNLEKTGIRAPFEGVIVNLPHYTPGVKVEQGKPMVGIMDYSRMYMDVNLPESVIGYIKTEQPVHITHYTIPDDTLSGVVNELSPAISIETRTFKGKILIRNDKLVLRPGMFVKADIIVDNAENSIIIPKDVIQSNRNRKYVYVVEKNTAVLRNIRTGLDDETNVQVLNGLNENDNLVIRGFETLRENSKVKVQK